MPGYEKTAYDAVFNDFLMLVRATDGSNSGHQETNQEVLAHREFLRGYIGPLAAAAGIEQARLTEFPRLPVVHDKLAL